MKTKIKMLLTTGLVLLVSFIIIGDIILYRGRTVQLTKVKYSTSKEDSVTVSRKEKEILKGKSTATISTKVSGKTVSPTSTKGKVIITMYSDVGLFDVTGTNMYKVVCNRNESVTIGIPEEKGYEFLYYEVKVGEAEISYLTDSENKVTSAVLTALNDCENITLEAVFKEVVSSTTNTTEVEDLDTQIKEKEGQ